jgi:undecaprenyl diphosphate synthase
VDPSRLTEADFEKHLSTVSLPEQGEVDLMIRTSGEKRISNFLLWQCSYAELDFPEVHWPEFTVQEYQKSLESFGKRKRRFGGV